jgi:hypothetical protein
VLTCDISLNLCNITLLSHEVSYAQFTVRNKTCSKVYSKAGARRAHQGSTTTLLIKCFPTALSKGKASPKLGFLNLTLNYSKTQNPLFWK